jgi:hypothetical protein
MLDVMWCFMCGVMCVVQSFVWCDVLYCIVWCLLFDVFSVARSFVWFVE